MPENSKPDPNRELHRALNNACRKWGAREIRLRYLPKPSLNRWIAEALIDHHRVVEKIRADIPAGEFTLQDISSFNDEPVARRCRRYGPRCDQDHVALKVDIAEKRVKAACFLLRHIENPRPRISLSTSQVDLTELSRWAVWTEEPKGGKRSGVSDNEILIQRFDFTRHGVSRLDCFWPLL